MDKPLQALDEIQRFLALHNIQHVVIGGIANAIWGRPRVTLDADLKVLAGQLWLEQFAEALERPELLQRYRSVLRAKRLD